MPTTKRATTKKATTKRTAKKATIRNNKVPPKKRAITRAKKADVFGKSNGDNRIKEPRFAVDGKGKEHKIDWKQVEELAGIAATYDEIASETNVPRSILTKHPNFEVAYKRGFERGKVSLRRTQFKIATKYEDKAMCIWLGKQYLGQGEPSGPQIAPDVETSLTTSADRRARLSKLSDKDMRAMRKILKKAEEEELVNTPLDSVQ